MSLALAFLFTCHFAYINIIMAGLLVSLGGVITIKLSGRAEYRQ